MENKAVINIGKKSFFSIVFILLGLIVVAGILAYFIPQGQYVGETFSYIENGERITIIKIITAPFLVLASDDAMPIIGISLFLLIVGGIFQAISDNNGLKIIVRRLVKKFADRKILMMRIIVLVLMLFSSVCGIFEEAVVLLPILIALSLALGWDVNVALGMCVLSIGLGYGAGTFNPYSIGIPAVQADADAMSGIWFRLIALIITYLILVTFLERYIKKIENKEVDTKKKITEIIEEKFENESRIFKAYASFFIGLMFAIIVSVIASVFLEFDGLMIVMAYFLIAGIIANFVSSGDIKKTLKSFAKGFISALPALVMIILAASVKYIIQEGQVIDTIIFGLANLMSETGIYLGIIILFFLIIVLEFFISSSTAKALLVMAIIAPLAPLMGLSRELSVLAYAYGDGFTNVLFPTSPVLLICLSMAGVSYRAWIKWTRNLFLLIFLLNIIYLLIAVLIGY